LKVPVFFKTKYHSLESPENYKSLEDYKSWKTTKPESLQRQEIRKSQEVCHVSRNQNLKSLEDWQSIRRGEKGREKINSLMTHPLLTYTPDD
jgi:hypothetical protein